MQPYIEKDMTASPFPKTSLEAVMNFIRGFFVFVPEGERNGSSDADHAVRALALNTDETVPGAEETLASIERYLTQAVRNGNGARLYIEPDGSIGHFLKLPGWQDGYTRLEVSPEFSDACNEQFESWVITVASTSVHVDDLCIWPWA